MIKMSRPKTPKTMIDTIILSIPREKVILGPVANGGKTWDLQARTGAYDKYVHNATAADEKTGLYFPRLTGYRRRFEGSTIRIEFSAPKLIYGNNLDELEASQFNDVVAALKDRMDRMSAYVSVRDLSNATVTAVHYSRNIDLRNGYTAQYVISELGKIDLNKRFDLARERYQNDGQSLHAHTFAHAFVVYDKIADLVRGRKAVDRDQTKKQLALFPSLEKRKEIVRFEVRLSQKKKMNAVFDTLGLGQNPTFRDVFSEERSVKVMTHYWNTMIEGNSVLLFAHALTPKDLLRQVILSRKKTKPNHALYLTGLIITARDGKGMRELRSAFGRKMNSRTWYRLVADLKRVAADLGAIKPRDWYDQVKSSIVQYQPFRIQNRAKNKPNKDLRNTLSGP